MEEFWEKIKPMCKLALIIGAIIYFWQNGLIPNIYHSVMKMTGKD